MAGPRTAGPPTAAPRGGVALRALEASGLLILAPLSWFPWQWPFLTLVALPIVPVAVLVRLRTSGRATAVSGLEAPLTYLLLATCLAMIPVVNVQLALPKLLGIALGAAIVITMGNWIDSPRAARRAGRVLTGLSMVLVGVGLVGTEWTTGKLVVLNAILERVPTLLTGFVPNTPRGGINPNELAGALVLVIPVLIGQVEPIQLASRQPKPGSVAAAVVATCGLLLLVATASRGAMTATVLVLTVWASVVIVRRWRDTTLSQSTRLAGLIGLAILVIVEAGAGWGIARRAAILAPGSSGPDTLQGRLEVWDRSLDMLRDFPFTGIGPGQFDPVFHLLYAPQIFRPDQFAPHAHNLLLAYGVELGLPGLAAFVVLLAAFFRCCWRALQYDDAYVRRTGLTLALGMLAFLGFGLTDAIAPGARGGVVLWAMLGFGGALGRLVSPGRCQTGGQQPDQRDRAHA